MTKIDFWKKIFIVFVGIFFFRIGSHIPVPGIDPMALSLYVTQLEGTMIEILNTFSGGSIKRFSILAVGITPYISASIIIQMFSFFNKHLKELKEEGERGQLKINQYTRYLTLIIAFMQAITLTSFISSQNIEGLSLVINNTIAFQIVAIFSLTTGSLFLLWLGEKLTEFGVGSGVSVIIFAGIISGMPETISSIFQLLKVGEINPIFMMFLAGLFLGLIYLITLVETSQRRIKLTSTDEYNNTGYLPLKINMAGIMPAIFATTILFIPLTFNDFIGKIFNFDVVLEFKSYFGDSPFIFLISFSALIVFFSFFYAGIIFNAKKTAANLQSSNSFVKGIRPGKPTEVFLHDTVKRLTLIGSIYMVSICLLPEILLNYFAVPFYLGGTTLLIMVLVAKEWLEQYGMSKHSEKYTDIKDTLMKNF
jgi:preprotein translocase subunit SecY